MGMLDDLADRMTGRTFAQRTFYNETRAGLLNSSTPPDDASPYGGLGTSLKTRRRHQALESQEIEDSVMRRQRNDDFAFGKPRTD